MTSRRTGRRVAAAASAKSATPKRMGKRSVRHADVPLRPKELRQLIQLVICGSIFVALVVVKLLIPGHMAQVNANISKALDRNMDVQAVFSAVGRAFTGEDSMDSTADEVYRAVFHAEDVQEAETVHMDALPDEDAIEILRGYRGFPEVQEPPRETTEIPEEDAVVSTLAYVLYSDRNLPENVSMEQDILNFDYCTPVHGSVTSSFGYRDHPVEGEERFHYGLDLGAETGTDISCFAKGTVTAVGESSSYGKYCIVSHEGAYTTLYAHCSRIVTSSGASVEAGEKIAEVGETGIATGPHLHFEIHKDGTYLNPIYYVSAAE